MIIAQNVLKSTKAYGKYEKPIIRRLKAFFEAEGYDVVPHARLNISWGSIISDVDLLLIKGNRLTAVEVKSARDKLSRAWVQLENVRDFVDYLYVATEKFVSNFSVEGVGIIEIHEKCIRIAKRAKLIRDIPSEMTFALLHKICLQRLIDGSSDKKVSKVGKYQLATRAIRMMKAKTRKTELQQMIACGVNCSTKCPILHFDHVVRLTKTS